jgi:fructokinase
MVRCMRLPVKPKCVIGLGEILWDHLPDGKRLGGAPANFAYHAMALGAESHPVSAVGDDAPGAEIRARLAEARLDAGTIAVLPGLSTGAVTVRLDERGVPDFTIHENAAWDHIPFTRDLKELAGRADAVCFGTLAQRSEKSHRTIRRFLERTPPRCFKIFDMNLRQRYYSDEMILQSLNRADVLKCNDGELPVLSAMLGIGGSEIEILKRLLSDFKLKLAALTMGEKGSRLVTPDGDSFLEAPKVCVADTVGAGDAFTAALAMGLLAGDPLRTIHENATRLAAFVCTQKGAMPEIAAIRQWMSGA